MVMDKRKKIGILLIVILLLVIYIFVIDSSKGTHVIELVQSGLKQGEMCGINEGLPCADGLICTGTSLGYFCQTLETFQYIAFGESGGDPEDS